MHDDAGWALAFAHLVDGVRDFVEADDSADTGRRVQPAVGHRVQRAVPVLRMRAAAELNRHSHVCRIGAVDRARDACT